jgi:hypothetical protein
VTTAGQDTGFDVEALADQAVELLVSAGQVIWIWASSHRSIWIEALACRIRARGRVLTLRLVIEPPLRRLGESARSRSGADPRARAALAGRRRRDRGVRDHGGHVPGVALARAGRWRPNGSR